VSVQPARADGPEGALDALNGALVAIHGACDAADKGRELRAGVEQFATSTGVYVPLFHGAGPLDDGSLRSEVVARNLSGLVGGDEGDGWLAQQLVEYAGFALFLAGSLLPRDAATALNLRVSESLKLLRQPPEAGRSPSYGPANSPEPRRGP
jgi:hypothetical protein